MTNVSLLALLIGAAFGFDGEAVGAHGQSGQLELPFRSGYRIGLSAIGGEANFCTGNGRAARVAQNALPH